MHLDGAFLWEELSILPIKQPLEYYIIGIFCTPPAGDAKTSVSACQRTLVKFDIAKVQLFRRTAIVNALIFK